MIAPYATRVCFALLLITSSCKGQIKERAIIEEHSLTAIAFYNVENLYDPADDPYTSDEEFTPSGANHYTEKIYRVKLHNIAFVLSQLAIDKNVEGPALIGLAEIENEKVLRDLVAEPELKNRNLKMVHFESPDHRGIDVALLYHPRYFKVIGSKALPVNITRNGKSEHTRDVLYVMGKLGDDTLHVFVNHWPSRREGEEASAWKRIAAAEVSKKIIDELTAKNKNVKCIVMGDLNDDPVDESVINTLNAEGNQQKVLPGGLFNPWMALYKKGIGSLAYQRKWNLFDQIIVSYGFINTGARKWKFYQAEVFNRDFLKNAFGRYKGYPYRSFSGNRWIKGYSDHFPTILYLTK
jgi:endonuclease/exonuclease/phosphatase family metal-dependent hydrolase